ncbi:MAG TPA: response regulator transcription factor [Dehalococcoidia bacterium]|nr:response regulator transcription factor [Dehalococcoidia bacterium]MDP6273058.1 response regulator transcription factor [Dehalococcoidia bacterium]MDP7161671.1 response regulator transcription factor [Dehalococcoidia bacterium]MDP7212216.1 response regulator transcription factor [Dehalococcoidia bacterium]MDP7515386.1 response regulator transcription factor [Dehalococcoidia bacterium]
MNIDTTQRRKSKPSVLVVDDDPKLRRLVERQLSAEGFDVLLASNGEEALYQASLSRPSLIVLDISMPVMDGFEALERLREFFTDPVIILSATDQEREKVRALDLGADDYLTKPFGGAELSARIRAALRRADRLSGNGSSQEPVVTTGFVEVDLSARIVKRRGEEVRLTRTEYDLLRILSTNTGKVLTHRELLQAVWGPEYGDETEYLRTFVKQLRRKLEEDPSRPRYIITEPGIGYRLVQVTD